MNNMCFECMEKTLNNRIIKAVPLRLMLCPDESPNDFGKNH